MMVMDRVSGQCQMGHFSDFPEFVRSGDCIVINDTRVLHARLFGHRRGSGGRVQAFMLKEVEGKRWQCLLKPGRRMAVGSIVDLEGQEGAFTVASRNEDGTFDVVFEVEDVLSLMEKAGQIPLPPYIRRTPTQEDEERYQTVYATAPGAVAAPTAGLHFTQEILASLEAKGVRIARLTLHVGAGTFKPVKSKTVEEHVMHEERYVLTPETAELINGTHRQGGRVICIGTTTVRVLETCVIPGTRDVAPGTGITSIFLYPPYKAIVPDALLTNFHLPQSTLLMLICTFAEKEKIFAAYRLAVENRFRFFSYGDCMLLI